MSYALLFPGQASQHVGMGADFPRLSEAAAEILALADRLTELPLRSVIAAGPLETLTDTRHAQPAVVATSLAALAAFREQSDLAGLPAPRLVAGHSVGELAAVTAAGALRVEEALRMVAKRSRLMAEACDRVEGGMAAVLGLEEAALQTLCEEASSATGELLELANLNAPDQLVVSGHQTAIRWLQRVGPSRGARRVIPLNVAGPFHSAYMRPAAAEFAAYLRAAPLRVASLPVVLNQTARPSRDPEEIRRELGEQIAAPVRWSDSLDTMAQTGCTLFLEIGPGQVLAGLVRRTLPQARVISVNDEASLARAVAAVGEIGG